MTARGFERRLAAAALSLALGGVAEASAHAPPAATEIQWLGESALVRTNRGLIAQDGAGGPFRMLCHEAFRTSLSEVPPFTTTPDGRLLIGTFQRGLVLSTPDHCSFAPTTGAQSGINAVAIAADSLGVIHALVIPPDGSPAALIQSSDEGRSFDAVATFSDPPSSLQVAPGHPKQLYVSVLGANAEQTFPRLLRSTDAGRSFEELPLALDASELRAYVLAVDALDPRVLFVRTQSRDGVTPERLLRSDDGGQSFAAVLEAPGPLSLTLAANGVVWAGSALGLYRSGDGGQTFVPFADLGLSRVTCLATRAQRLFVCGYYENEFGVVTSQDEGSSLSWFLRFPQVQTRLGCAAESDEGSLCGTEFDDWSSEQHADDEPADQSSAGAGGEPTHGAPRATAGCSLAGPVRPTGTPFLLLLAPLITLTRLGRDSARRKAMSHVGAAAITATLMLACGPSDSGDPTTARGSGAAGGGGPGSAGSAGSGSAGGGSAGAGAGAGDRPSESDDTGFETLCLASAASTCERCLCTECTGPLKNCSDTPGCPEIAACIRASQCVGIACYCGTFEAVACAAGESNGPCKVTILEAPGARVPSLLDPSAGPASDAAVSIAGCAEPGESCAEACPTGG